MADDPKPKTGLDDALSLEATYYATPIPQNMAVLTILGAVFDKVHFPGVVMPLGFGIIGYIARKTGYEVTAILIGVLMGPLFEQYFLRALRVGQGDPTILFSSTLGNVLWVMVVLALILPWLRDRRRQGVLAQTVRAGHE